MLNDEAPDAEGRYVLYWTKQSQRAQHNPALEVTVRRANEHGVSVIVGFGLMDDYPEATERHYAFSPRIHRHRDRFLKGLSETRVAHRSLDSQVRTDFDPAAVDENANSYGNVGWIFGLHDRGRAGQAPPGTRAEAVGGC